MSAPLLLGPASLDRWLDEDRILPGGGALNMAYHWSRLGQPFTLLTRIGDDHPDLFLNFMHRFAKPCFSLRISFWPNTPSILP